MRRRNAIAFSLGAALALQALPAVASSDASSLARVRYEQGFRMVFQAKTPLDGAVALSLIISAAKGGYVPAYTLLGTMVGDGSFVDADPELAASLLGVAAAAGDATAKNNLARLLGEGEGVMQDLPKARRLAAEASSEGVTSARDFLASLDTVTSARPQLKGRAAQNPKAKKALGKNDGSYFIQVAAVGLDANPEAEWSRLKRLYKESLGRGEPIYQVVDVESQTYIRILVGPFAEASAKDVCKRLAERGARGCLVRRP
jgi:TPR repeat protein